MGAWIPFVPKLHPLVVIAEGYRDRLAVSLSSCPAVQNGRPVGAAPSSDAEGVVGRRWRRKQELVQRGNVRCSTHRHIVHPPGRPRRAAQAGGLSTVIRVPVLAVGARVGARQSEREHAVGVGDVVLTVVAGDQTADAPARVVTLTLDC